MPFTNTFNIALPHLLWAREVDFPDDDEKDPDSIGEPGAPAEGTDDEGDIDADPDAKDSDSDSAERELHDIGEEAIAIQLFKLLEFVEHC